MNAHDLRQMETADLRAKAEALREDLFKLRFQHSTAQLNDPTRINKTRRSLARTLTILRERELSENPEQRRRRGGRRRKAARSRAGKR